MRHQDSLKCSIAVQVRPTTVGWSSSEAHSRIEHLSARGHGEPGAHITLRPPQPHKLISFLSSREALAVFRVSPCSVSRSPTARGSS
mmetsp:Transcript_25590/g.77173  ORF Transcript_25590/g.77173 Transcript_25590/m.77173 type:complete len:87 (+) Transcript_25590:108-368(+)